MANATSPFNQPVGQALVQAAQLINNAAQNRQRLELERERFEFQKQQFSEAANQRESTFKMKEEEFQLRQDIEARRRQEFELKAAEEEGATPRAELELKKLEAETKLIDERREALDNGGSPDIQAQVRLIEKEIDASLTNVGGDFSQMTIAQLQRDVASGKRLSARERADPLREIVRKDMTGSDQLPSEVVTNNKTAALNAKLDARETHIVNLPPEKRAIARRWIAAQRGAGVRTQTDSGEQLVREPEPGDLSTSTRDLINSMNANRIQTDTTFRKNSAQAVARQLLEAHRNGLDPVSLRALTNEITSRFGQEFNNEVGAIITGQ
jgi:hypothetical protein